MSLFARVISRRSAGAPSLLLARSSSGALKQRTCPLLIAKERVFSTTVESDLGEILDEEIENERENAITSTVQSLIENFSKQGKSIRHESGSGRVEIALEHATISFDCRDVVSDEDVDEGALDQNPSSVEFDVNINKGGARLIFECLATEDNGVTIESVSYYGEKQDDSVPDIYDGPKFNELDPRLQAAFYTYLDNIGITLELSTFINNFATQKEALEYLTWLENVRSFVISK